MQLYQFFKTPVSADLILMGGWLDSVVDKLHSKHPVIKAIRIYTELNTLNKVLQFCKGTKRLVKLEMYFKSALSCTKLI